MSVQLEKFTGHIWEEWKTKDLVVGDLIRARLGDVLEQNPREGWLVVVGRPFKDADDKWNVLATEYPEGTKIH